MRCGGDRANAFHFGSPWEKLIAILLIKRIVACLN
ncbi:hypothetical protein I7I48_03083 [Histoplasma ohiense]|nr:hypothetical protein I7I48_03083 [Histoplasma ohiense (nom. inval.)]